MSMTLYETCENYAAPEIIISGGLSIIFLCMSGIVINDFIATQSFSNTLCSGNHIVQHVESGGVCSWGTVESCVSRLNGTCIDNTTVTLFYPPLENSKYLICKTTESVHSWVAGIAGAESLSCYLNSDGTYGITTHSDAIAGWSFMMMIGILLGLAMFYTIWEVIQKRRYGIIP